MWLYSFVEDNTQEVTVLDTKYKLERKIKGEYHLSLPIDADWSKKSQRVLVVLETVDSQDLHESTLLFDRSRTVVENLLRFSSSRAKLHGFKRADCAFAAVNYNNIKFMDKPKETWPAYKKAFSKRIRRAIKQLEPTHILVCGDHAAESLLTEFEIEHINKKRGWVYDLEIAAHKVKVVTTLDLNPLYTASKKDQDDDDDDDSDDDIGKDIFAKSNLLFYVSDHIVNLLMGRHLFDLSHIRPKPVYIDTLDKFKKFYAKLLEQKAVALDTETRNGTVRNNAIHTIQFAFEEGKGYFLPYRHPDTPWSKEELRYIRKKLRAWLMARPGECVLKYLITQYGMFDLRICRVEFGIPVIRHAVWEITAGEYCLDENRSQLAGKPFHTPHGGLEQIFMVYGNDHYKRSPFGKGDRANMQLTKLDNPDFIDYGVMDVQSIFGIHNMQKERAKYLFVGDKPFLPYFKRLVLLQMSNTTHSLSHMMEKGSQIDKAYLALLKSNASPLLKLLNEAKNKMLASKEVKRANKLLLKENSGQASHGGLFGTGLTVFDFGKQSHKEMLFFNVMGLKPVSFTKNKSPQINKLFIKAYEKDQPIVEAFGKYQKLSKLWSAYVKGWWNKIQDSVDAKMDWKLRASYGFFNVVTGRLNSYDPSLQQVPSRGAEAKYIKRAFIAPPGCLLVKFDYSAHEVRVWSYVSGDEEIASTFKVGQKLRQKLYLAKTKEKVDEIMKELKQKGDIHIQNVKFFFDQWVDKDHPLRDAIKAVVFGVIYSKSAKSLAKDVKQTVEFAQDLIDKLFGRFKKGAKWLNWTKKHVEDKQYTYSPIGMRRNLHGVLTGVRAIVGSMLRKAANSPIQGFASQIGVTASRLVDLHVYDTLLELGFMTEDDEVLPADIVKAVHDALHSEVPYEIVIIYIHILQWVATYGVTAYYKEKFGVDFPVEPEIEVEIGASEDAMYKWNWREDHLLEIIDKALVDQVNIKHLKEDPKVVKAKIMKAYENKKVRKYLETNYPILGVVRKAE